MLRRQLLHNERGLCMAVPRLFLVHQALAHEASAHLCRSVQIYRCNRRSPMSSMFSDNQLTAAPLTASPRRPLTSDVNGIHSVQSSTPQAYRLFAPGASPGLTTNHPQLFIRSCSMSSSATCIAQVDQ